MATAVKAVRTLVAAATPNTSGSTQRGAGVDLRTALGGILTLKMTNGTAPTTQCVCNVLIAHDTGTLPTLASAGSVWKTLFSVGNGIVASDINEFNFTMPAGVMHLSVEFVGNTGATVNVEALFAELTSVS